MKDKTINIKNQDFWTEFSIEYFLIREKLHLKTKEDFLALLFNEYKKHKNENDLEIK